MDSQEIKKHIKPINELEETIISDEEFIKGVNWGKPRKGHPEGKVLYHIKEVLKNIDEYSPHKYKAILRIIAIIHDTFKYQVNYKKSKQGENHHAYKARKFGEKYNLPNYVLDIIEFHDDAYNAWNKGYRKNQWGKAKKRAINLIKKLNDNIELYLLFYKCDNNTGNKSQDCYWWFKKLVKNYYN